MKAARWIYGTSAQAAMCWRYAASCGCEYWAGFYCFGFLFHILKLCVELCYILPGLCSDWPTCLSQSDVSVWDSVSVRLCFTTKSANPFKDGCKQTMQVTSCFMIYSESVNILQRSTQAELTRDNWLKFYLLQIKPWLYFLILLSSIHSN